MKKIKVGLIGCGTIGSEISRAIEREIPEMELVALSDLDRIKAKNLEKSLPSHPKVVSPEELIELVDLVIEAASKEASDSIARAALNKGKDIMIMSVGGLLGQEDTFSLAKKKNCRIYLPSGAIAGLDGIKSASQGKIYSLILTTRKPSSSLARAPYILENKIDLDSLTSPKLIFEGSAKEAVDAFPQNINVAATVSLGGIGAEATTVRIIADPTLDKNIHEIVIKGDFGKMACRCENLPSPSNPRTSYLAPLSAISTLKNIVTRVGGRAGDAYMKCKKVQKLLSDYLDGEVKEREKELLEAHLSECPHCRKELESYKKTEELIKLKVKEEPAPEFWEGCWPEFKAKLEKENRVPQFIERRNIPFKLLREPLFIGATACAVILILMISLISLSYKYRELGYIFQKELLARKATYQQIGIEDFLQTLVTSRMREEVEDMEEALSRFPQAEIYLEEVVAEILSLEEEGGELL
jgi:aspartate dehydrogenase